MEDHSKGIFNQALVLILGAPRSGTTLLAAMLGSHEQTSILMEDYYGGAFRVLSKRLPGVKLCMPNQIELVESKSMVRANKVFNLIIRAWNTLVTRLGIPPVAPRVIRSVYSINDYLNCSSKLHLVSILRNPIDATDSEKSRAGASAEYARGQWLRALDILKELYDKRDDFESFTIVDFDSLVAQPEAVIKQVFPKLGLEFSEVVVRP